MNLYTVDTGQNTGFDYYVSTDNAYEFVTLEDIKDRMDLPSVDDEDVMYNQIKGVRIYLESVLNMCLTPAKTITAYWQTFSDRINLPFAPVSSVTSVTRVAHSDGTETALAASEYWVEGVNKKAVRLQTVYRGYGMKIVYIVALTDVGMISLVKDAILSEVVEWFHQRTNPDETQYVLGKIAMSKLNTFRPL